MTLTPELEAAIVKHALEQPSQEVCGLLIRLADAFSALPCPNVSPQPEKSFLMRPSDYFSYLRDGTLVGYYHSHHDQPETPSEADKKVSESAKLPVVTYSLLTKQFSVYNPNGYVTPLLGRRFEFGIFDCLSLFCDYYDQKLGIKVPYIPRSVEFIRNGMADLHRTCVAREFVLVEDEENLRPNDLICMSLGTAEGKCNHVAVYLGNSKIIQQLLYRPSEEVYYGGYWVKHTVSVYRHKKFL